MLWNLSLSAQGQWNKSMTWAEAIKKSYLAAVKESTASCSRAGLLIFTFFSGLNHCISWHTFSKHQSVRKLLFLSAARSLLADLIPSFHLRLSPSEMELCHLVGYQCRIKNYFQKTITQWSIHLLLKKHSGLLKLYVMQRPTLLEEGCKQNRQIKTFFVNMVTLSIIF